MSETTTIIKAVTTADVVALTEASAGLELRNCVVVLPFWHRRSNGAFRIPLPPLRDVDAVPPVVKSLTTATLALLARLDGCNGVAIVAYSDDPFVAADCPLTDLLEGLLERFAEAGYAIKDAAIVARDGWCAHFDDSGERDLSELEAARAAIPPELRQRTAPEHLPPRDGRLAQQVCLALLERLDDIELDSFGSVRSHPLPDPLDLLEELLAQDPHTVGPLSLARLLATLRNEGDVDRTVLQIAFGRSAAGRHPYEDSHTARLLAGDTRQRPDAGRLSRGAKLLGRAVVHCPLPERSWAMCALAWVRWALGIASAADALITEAARVDPYNSLVPVYASLLRSSHPAWIFDRRPPTNRKDRRAAARAARRDALVRAIRDEPTPAR
ncbi:hypothetical protein [Microbacterium sp.]|uniref:hypothetical protein n=1 Tax=Microbacterium sp. TaxID=51671 RepID=UPI003C75587A